MTICGVVPNRSAIGERIEVDPRAAGDPKRLWWDRLLHAALLDTGVGGPNAAALKSLGLHVVAEQGKRRADAIRRRSTIQKASDL